MFRKKIKIKYFDPELPKIHKFKNGDWIDLRAAETVDLKAGDFKIIKLGVGMILPKGYEAIIAPRSSTFAKYHIMLVNSIGIIDNSYKGEKDQWNFLAYAFSDSHIEKGDRLCQFRIFKNQPRVKLKVVDHLKKISRGGIGSTGKK